MSMIKHRHNTTRKHMGDTWIETYRSFSNNSYWDPEYVHYSLLEVINDDRIQPHNFVPIHQHMDMEILGYVVEGDCYHNDNHRNIVEVPTHGVQHMTSGTGIWHIEGNNTNKPVRYLQVWLRPNKMGIQPKYDGYIFDYEEKLNNLCLVASQNDAPITIQSDAIVHCGIFTENYHYQLDDSKKYYLYVITGKLKINDIMCEEGDAVIYENETLLEIIDPEHSEILLFTLP